MQRENSLSLNLVLPNIKIMYQTNRRELVREAGAWLGETSWDFFSTFTYRYDIKQKQNYKIMEGLRSSLQKLGLPHYIFYVTEFTSSSSTHNYMLIKGDGVKEAVESHLRAKPSLQQCVTIITRVAQELTITSVNLQEMTGFGGMLFYNYPLSY